MTGSSPPVGSAAGIAVDVDDRQQAYPVDSDHLARVLAATLGSQHDAVKAEVGLAFVTTDEMASLNVEHMGGTGPTDVLAFPIDGVHGSPVPDGQPSMLGDIVICPAVADKAPQPLRDELALLVVHGALHLLGHDHAEPDETALMQTLEQQMLERFHRS